MRFEDIADKSNLEIQVHVQALKTRELLTELNPGEILLNLRRSNERLYHHGIAKALLSADHKDDVDVWLNTQSPTEKCEFYLKIALAFGEAGDCKGGEIAAYCQKATELCAGLETEHQIKAEALYLLR